MLIFGWGCSGTVQTPGPSAGTDPALPSNYADDLRKKVAMVPVQVETAFADRSTGDVIQDALAYAVQDECPDIVFLMPGDSEMPPALIQPPRLTDNQIDNFELASIGRQHGLSAVLVVALTSINMDEKPWGFWFFKRMRYYVQGEMLVDIYDSETATKLFSRTVGYAMEIDDLDMELIRSRNRFDNYLIQNIIEEIIEDAYEPICETLEKQPWKSYLRTSGNDDLMIASGQRSGLRPGHVLEVFDSSAIIEGVNGHRYYLSGQKIGEVKIQNVSTVSAQAVSLADQPLPDGSMVKMRD